ncbi:MAG: DUF86 domain-containing protein [Gammaproteobacteria bacterium]|nr:DUF86 domain-containing protein [Gammaproteobacteria bacterium]
MTHHSDAAWIIDMLHVMRRIVAETDGISFPIYLNDGRLQRSCLYDLMVLGEASGNLSDEFKDKYGRIPWHQMTGLRNRLIHEYFNVNHAIVWEVLTNEIPDLLPLVETLSSELDQQ